MYFFYDHHLAKVVLPGHLFLKPLYVTIVKMEIVKQYNNSYHTQFHFTLLGSVGKNRLYDFHCLKEVAYQIFYSLNFANI